jgi:antitoxin ParD1/3/4
VKVEIGPEFEQLVRSKVESGAYSSPEEVVGKALRYWAESDRTSRERLESLIADVGIGLDQLDSGDATDWTGDSLEQWADATSRGARANSQARNANR